MSHMKILKPKQLQSLSRNLSAICTVALTIFSIQAQEKPHIYTADSTRDSSNDGFSVLQFPKIDSRIHFAQSGAIWKLHLGELGNIIGAQHADSLFIDRVIQSVATQKAIKNSTGKWFMHQAGVYKRHGRERVYFSPQIFHWARPTTNTIDFLNLPQQAHDPSQSNNNYAYFNHQKIEVLTERSFKMIYRWTHQGEVSPRLDHFNFPWAVFDRKKLPFLGILDSDGQRISRVASKAWNETMMSDASMGSKTLSAVGFYSQAEHDKGTGITFVFPKNGDSAQYRVGHSETEDIMVLSRIPKNVNLNYGSTIDSGDIYVLLGNRKQAEEELAKLDTTNFKTISVAAQKYFHILKYQDRKTKKMLFSRVPYFEKNGYELVKSNLGSFQLYGGSHTQNCSKKAKLLDLEDRKNFKVRRADRQLCSYSPYYYLDIR